MNNKLVQKEITSKEEVAEIYFDVTLIINNENEITVVDNTQSDYHDFLDCNTLTFKKVKVQVC